MAISGVTGGAIGAVRDNLFNSTLALNRERVFEARRDDSIAFRYGNFDPSSLEISEYALQALAAVADANLGEADKKSFIQALARLNDAKADPGSYKDMMTLVRIEASQYSGKVSSLSYGEARSAFEAELAGLQKSNMPLSESMLSDQIKINNANLAAPEATYLPELNPYKVLAKLYALNKQQDPFATPNGNVVNVTA